MGYNEGVITVERLEEFISLPDCQAIRKAFREYRDECFGVEDAGMEYEG
jgi:hypothetical protein